MQPVLGLFVVGRPPPLLEENHVRRARQGQALAHRGDGAEQDVRRSGSNRTIALEDTVLEDVDHGLALLAGRVDGNESGIDPGFA